MKTAVILAAGLGSRLHPLTRDKPKCMVTAAGRPILDYQLCAYEKAGFDKVYIIGGFRVEEIKSWLATRPGKMPVEIIDNREFDVTNNMYSLFLARDRVAGQPFFLSNGDVVFDQKMLAALVAAPDTASYITVDTGLFLEESMKIVVDGAGRVCGLSKRYAQSEARAVSTDLYRFSAAGSRRLFDIIADTVVEKRERNQWTEVALDRILKTTDHDFHYVDIAGLPWVEVDNLQDLAQADLLFARDRDLIAAAKAFVFDIDGTLAIDGELIPGAADVVRHLQKTRKVFFCTNNSSRSRADYGELLRSFGLTCRAEDIVSSIGATIAFLRNRGIGSVFVLGTPALKGELQQAGFACHDPKPDIAVVGFDKTLTFDAAAQASQLIARGCPYILTHPDVACPTPAGPIPDAGAIGAMLQAATGIAPVAVLGKPSRSMLQPLFDMHGLRPDQVVMIGDRLATDILMAEQVGCLSALVLSGITARAEVERGTIKPGLIIDSVAALAGLWPMARS